MLSLETCVTVCAIYIKSIVIRNTFVFNLLSHNSLFP